MLIAGLSLCAPAVAQVTNTDLWITNGMVFSLARDGNILYVGGEFSAVGAATGQFLPLSQLSGAIVEPFPKVSGTVYAVASDGAGGWYLGGALVAVGGQPRACLAHVLGDGSVADWDPTVISYTGDQGYPAAVYSLAVSGNTVYASGRFDKVAGQVRVDIAAIDGTTGTVTAWYPNKSWGCCVYALALGDTVIYAGGSGGVVAAFGRTSGLATPWNPNPNGAIHALAVSGGVVYAGGEFTSIGGQGRSRIAALDATTGLATAWNPNANGEVDAIASNGSTLYVGGLFTSIGGQARNYVAALDVATGLATAWSPNPDNRVSALAVGGTSVFVGGNFGTIAGQSRLGIAAVDATTGLPTPFDPKLNNATRALAVNDSMVYTGGEFSMAGALPRSNLAAFELTTGAATDWAPNANGHVVALAKSGGTVYAGGEFTNVGGQVRHYLAALDATTGVATQWNPSPDWYVEALAVAGSTIYAGGGFGHIAGQTRHGIAALDSASGTAIVWAPEASGGVLAIAVSGNTVYAGGFFDYIGGQPRGSVAALDATSGLATDWTPNPPYRGGEVLALAVQGNTVYIGGSYTSMGDSARENIASVDATTGAVNAWKPQASGQDRVMKSSYVYALAVDAGTVYIGGDYMYGSGGAYLFAADAETGLATAWRAYALSGDPSFPPIVHALTVGDGSVCIGGDFPSMGLQPQEGVAVLSTGVLDAPLRTESRSLSLAQSFPNPARSHALIRFTLPLAGPVTLPFYDLQGRRVASLLDRAPRPAGLNEVRVQTAGWRPGCYFYRLEAGGARVTRKLVVLD
jgi:hypothetical protein